MKRLLKLVRQGDPSPSPILFTLQGQKCIPNQTLILQAKLSAVFQVLTWACPQGIHPCELGLTVDHFGMVFLFSFPKPNMGGV